MKLSGTRSRIFFCALILSLLGGTPLGAEEAVPAEAPLRWWKGNIHTHSFWSDGNDFPEMIAEWYRTHGYHFLALSDHNILSDGDRWMAMSEIVRRGGPDVLAKYRARFGPDWVETRGEPGSAVAEVRLKPLSEFRALVEERGAFLMIQGEEISDRAEGVPVHMNATNLAEVIQPVGGATVREAIENNLRAVQEQASRSGREILAHLNHPNFGYAVTAEDLAAALSERFFEVYNGHPGVAHLGDQQHPGVERMWDIANTIRLDHLVAPPLFGVATDDSHEYRGRSGSRPGRGWIFVRSRYLTPEHLIRAIRRGDSYASSGVTLEAIHYDVATKVLELQIQPQEGVTYETEFIGTRVDYDASSQPRLNQDGVPLERVTRKYSAEIGTVLAVSEGLRPAYPFTGRELYVRARVTSSRPHPDPSFEGQYEQAWTQPFGWSAQ